MSRREEFVEAAELKQGGWTEAGIRKFLGTPDGTRPGRYGGSPPIRLWLRTRVADVEASEGWREWLRTSTIRRDAAREVARTKWRATVDDVESALEEDPPTVPDMTREDLTRRAYAHWRSRAAESGRSDDPPSGDAHEARLCVNYLRHECTDYERRLTALYGRVGKQEAIEVIRDAIYGAIADAYPDLANECDRQSDARRLD